MPSTLSPFHPILRPIFSGVLPQKLKHHFLRPHILQRRLLVTRGGGSSPVPFGTNRFSTRSGRERMGSSYGQDARAGSSKSLIDDEADLSDWVSGLNSKSFMNTRVYSDSEKDEDDRGNAGLRSREGAGKRRREGESGKDSAFTSGRGGGGRSSRDFGLPSGRGRGGGGRGSRDSEIPSRRGVGETASRRGGGNRSSEPFSGTGSVFGGRSGVRDSTESRRGEKFGGPSEARRGGNNGFSNRGSQGSGEKRQGERGLDMRQRNGRDGVGARGGLSVKREGKWMVKRGSVTTDDEDVEAEDETDKGYSSFKELIDSDEVDDVDEEDEDEDEEEEVGADGLSEKGKLSSQSTKSSSQNDDSYLSESRCF